MTEILVHTTTSIMGPKVGYDNKEQTPYLILNTEERKTLQTKPCKLIKKYVYVDMYYRVEFYLQFANDKDAFEYCLRLK